jgi:hypothetical protein
MKKRQINKMRAYWQCSSPLLKANKFNRAGLHISLFYNRRLKYFSTEYLSGVIVETTLTTVDVFPRFIN